MGTFLGLVHVTTDATGEAIIAASLPPLAAGMVVTATATDQITQDTSELSNAVAAVDVPPTLNVSDVSAAESDSGITNVLFTVTLVPPAPTDVTFRFSTADGTATAPSDYTATTGTGVIPAGSTSTMIAVPLLGDELPEGDETFTVTISGITGATAGDVEGEATITNDDTAAVAIPTLTEWLLALMTALLAVSGVLVMARAGP